MYFHSLFLLFLGILYLNQGQSTWYWSNTSLKDYSSSSNYTTPFQNDKWIINKNYLIQNTTTCGNTWLLGGLNAFGQGTSISKSYNIPGYNTLQISFTFYAIDAWDNDNFFVLSINGEIIASWIYNQLLQNSSWDLCGNMDINEIIVPFTWVNSNFDDITLINITISTNLAVPINSASWGIKNVKVENKKCYERCINCQGPSSAECLACKKPYYFLYGQGCYDTCPNGYWQNNTIVQKNRLCIECNVLNCMDCKQDFIQCAKCIEGYFLMNNYTCLKCPGNCLQCSEYGYCIQCNNGYLLVDPNLCVESYCPLYHYISMMKNPLNSNSFMFKCLPQIVIQQDIVLTRIPWIIQVIMNDTHTNITDNPMSRISISLSTTTELISRSTYSYEIQLSPDNLTLTFILYFTNHIFQGTNLTIYFKQDNYTPYYMPIRAKSIFLPFIYHVNDLDIFIIKKISFGLRAGVFILGISYALQITWFKNYKPLHNIASLQLLYWMQYINTIIPFNVLEFWKEFNSDLIEYVPNFFIGLNNTANASTTMPDQFWFLGETTYFLEIFGSRLSLSLIILTIWVLLKILRFYHSYLTIKLNHILIHIQNHFEWSIFLSLLFICLQSIILSASLAIYTWGSNSNYRILNCILSMILSICGVFIIIIIGYNLIKISKIYGLKIIKRANMLFFKKRKIIHSQFDQKSKTNLFIIFIFLLRGLFIPPCLIFLQDLPLITISMYIISSLLTLLLLLHKFPFKERITNLIQIALEILFLKASFFLMNFALRTDQTISDMNTRYNNGWAMIIVISLIIIIAILEALYYIAEFILILIFKRKSETNLDTYPKRLLIIQSEKDSSSKKIRNEESKEISDQQ